MPLAIIVLVFPQHWRNKMKKIYMCGPCDSENRSMMVAAAKSLKDRC